jgi:AcrR family transcriptional regulator
MATTEIRRQTADERREAVLSAATQEFAERGFHGASTEAIARAAGISQPYLFRLFGTKKSLYLATARTGMRVVIERMAAAAEGATGPAALHAMGEAYEELIRSDPMRA